MRRSEMAASDPAPDLEDVGPEEDLEAVARVDQPPSDIQIRGVYEKLEAKYKAGMSLESLKASYILANFLPGNTEGSNLW